MINICTILFMQKSTFMIISPVQGQEEGRPISIDDSCWSFFLWLRWYMLIKKTLKKLCYTSEKVNELRKSLFQHPRMTNQQGTKSWGWTWVHRGPIALKSKNIWLHNMGLRAASDQDIANQGLRLIVEIDAVLLNGWSDSCKK